MQASTEDPHDILPSKQGKQLFYIYGSSWAGPVPALPSPADNAPLLPKSNGVPISSTNLIRSIVQFCFDKAIEQLNIDGFTDDAEALAQATVHWLRHTGISDDVKIRPREHVRDDAGHSSSAITDKYIDVEKRERHRSAKRKQIDHELET